MTGLNDVGELVFLGDQPSSPLALEIVSSFKYLGVTLSSKPYRLFSDFNDIVVKKCDNFCHSILSLTHYGPDRAFMALTLWRMVALPSILYGVECVQLHAQTIQKIESTQNKVAKFALQTPPSSVNLQVLVDAGLFPVRFIIAQMVLTYAEKLRTKPGQNLASLCYFKTLSEHTKFSSYVMSQLELLPTFPHFPKDIHKAVNLAVCSFAHDVLPSFPTCLALTAPDESKIGQVKPWVNDSHQSAVYARFRSMNCGLGNRYPTVAGFYSKDCPFCQRNGVIAKNNEIHLAIVCPHFEHARKQTIIHSLVSDMKQMDPPMSETLIFKSLLDDQRHYHRKVGYGLTVIFDKWEHDLSTLP